MKKKSIIILSVLIAAGLTLTALEISDTINLLNKKAPTNDISESLQNTSETNNPSEELPTSSEEAEEQIAPPAPQNTPSQTQSDPNQPRIELEVGMSSGGTIRLFAKLFNVTEGTCSVVIKNGEKQINQTDTVYAGTEYGSCAGFSERKENMGAGNWVFDFTLNTKGKVYTASTTYLVP